VHGLLLHGINTTDFLVVVVVVVLASFGACKPQAKFARELTLVGYVKQNWPVPSNKPAIGDGPQKWSRVKPVSTTQHPLVHHAGWMDGWMDGWMNE